MKYLYLLLFLSTWAGSLDAQIYVKPLLLGPVTNNCYAQAVVEGYNLSPTAYISDAYGYQTISDGDTVSNLCAYDYYPSYYSSSLYIYENYFGSNVLLASSNVLVPRYNYEITNVVLPSDLYAADGSYLLHFDSILDPNEVWVASSLSGVIPATWLNDTTVFVENASYRMNYLYFGNVTTGWENISTAGFYIGDPEELEKPKLNAWIDYSSTVLGCTGYAQVYTQFLEDSVVFDWGIPNAPNSYYIDSLCEGDYTVTVSDNSGDTVRLNFTIQQYHLSGYPWVTQATFGCTGSVEIQTSFAEGPVTYDWGFPGADEGPFQDSLCPGDYAVRITDSAGYESYVYFSVYDHTPPLMMDVSYTPGVRTCTGTATATAYNAYGPVTYQWYLSGNPIGTNEAFQDSLCPGDYFVMITDSAQRSYYFSFPIQSLALDGYVSVDQATFGCTGKATVYDYYADGPLSYQWSVPGAADTAVLENLCPGDYWVIISDSTQSAQLYFTVADATPPLYASVDYSYNTRNCDATANVIVSNAYGPVTYEWSFAGADAGPYQDSLCPGSYWVMITDSAQRTYYYPFYIQDGHLDAYIDTYPSYSECSGYVAVYAYNNIGPVTYTWSFSGTSYINYVSGVCPGTYSVMVTDGDDTIYRTFTIEDLRPPLYAYVMTSESIDSSCGGSASAYVYNRTGAVQYIWSVPGAANEPLLDSLCPGTYTLAVTDESGDTIWNTFTIFDPTLVLTASITTTNVTDGNCNGTAQISLSGNEGEVQFYWSNSGLSQDSSKTNLCPGYYYVEIGDASGDYIYLSFYIYDSTQIPLTVTTTVYPGSGECDGEVYINYANADGPVRLIWDIPGVVDTSYAGNICPGQHTVMVTDGDDTIYVSFTIPDNIMDAEIILAEPAIIECSGAIRVEAHDAVAPVVYDWSIPGAVNEPFIDSLCPGNYSVLITDASGDSVYLEFTIDYIDSTTMQDSLFYELYPENYTDCFMDPELPFDSTGHYWQLIYSGHGYANNFFVKVYGVTTNLFQNGHFLSVYDTVHFSNLYGWLLYSRTVTCIDMSSQLALETPEKSGDQQILATGQLSAPDEIRIYPNPSSDYLHVDLNGTVRIDMFDAYGKLVRNSTSASTYIGDLAEGIYLLRINGGKELYRFVKIN